jgi:hypothetical protein
VQRLDLAKADLGAFDAAGYEDIEEALAEYNRLFDTCTSWFGSVVESDYDKAQRMIGVCPLAVKMEYAEFISPKYDGVEVDEMLMTWDEFEVLIRKVWKAASVKIRIRGSLGAQVPAVDKKPVSFAAAVKKTRVPVPADAAPVVAPAVAAPRSSSYVECQCDKCSKTFNPSSNQIMKHKEEGHDLPGRCPKCKGQVCDNFKENGKCSYGDGCRFLHPDEFKPISKPGGAPAIEAKKEHVYSASMMAGRFSATTIDDKGRFTGAIVPVVPSVAEDACGFGHSRTPDVFSVD